MSPNDELTHIRESIRNRELAIELDTLLNIIDGQDMATAFAVNSNGVEITVQFFHNTPRAFDFFIWNAPITADSSPDDVHIRYIYQREELAHDLRCAGVDMDDPIWQKGE